VNRAIQTFEVAMKALLVKGGKLLLLREATGLRYWELPGGRIEVGEERVPPVEVLRRELAEELGAAIAYDVVGLELATVRPFTPPRSGGFVFLVGWLCRFTGGEIELSDEHAEFRWVSAQELAAFELAPGYRAALEEAFARGL
jgi:8-oxo-dGTP pyrophosphatase MutT (NUDIX family)